MAVLLPPAMAGSCRASPSSGQGLARQSWPRRGRPRVRLTPQPARASPCPIRLGRPSPIALPPSEARYRRRGEPPVRVLPHQI
ncbi:hypothetical protein NL676_025051 [Syzygium grande]|nr:hypothetical protein NL676_025051 [Syzygium grande]